MLINKKRLAPLQTNEKAQKKAINRFRLKNKSHDARSLSKNFNENSYGYANDQKERNNQTLDYDFSNEHNISEKKKRDLKEYFNHKKFITGTYKKPPKGALLGSTDRDAYMDSSIIIHDASPTAQNAQDPAWNRSNMSSLSRNAHLPQHLNSSQQDLPQNDAGQYEADGNEENSQINMHNIEGISKISKTDELSEESDIKDQPSPRENMLIEEIKEEVKNEAKGEVKEETKKEESKFEIIQIDDSIYETEDEVKTHITTVKILKPNSSQEYRNWHPSLDTTLHWSKADQKLPVDSYKNSIVPQSMLEKDNQIDFKHNEIELYENPQVLQTSPNSLQKIHDQNLKLLEQENLKFLEEQKIIIEKKTKETRQLEEMQKSQKKLEQNHEKLNLENAIQQKLIKDLQRSKESSQKAPPAFRFFDPAEKQAKKEVYKVKNVDWYESAINKAVKEGEFDENVVPLDELERIYQDKTNSYDLNSTSFVREGQPDEDPSAKTRNFIAKTLESDEDIRIRFDEIDTLLSLIKERFSGFKRDKDLKDFFDSASFTLYALTLDLCLPETHFFRIMGKYEDVVYETTIKLLIRCKIFYEARVILTEILQNFSELEYKCQLEGITREIWFDTVEEVDESINARRGAVSHTDPKYNWKLVYPSYIPSNSVYIIKELEEEIREKIETFRKISPFDRDFIYRKSTKVETDKEDLETLKETSEDSNQQSD